MFVEHQAIKGFNREWACVERMRDKKGEPIGWQFVSACNLTGRLFPDRHWDDSYGAAMQALESHHCLGGTVAKAEHTLGVL